MQGLSEQPAGKLKDRDFVHVLSFFIEFIILQLSHGVLFQKNFLKSSECFRKQPVLTVFNTYMWIVVPDYKCTCLCRKEMICTWLYYFGLYLFLSLIVYRTFTSPFILLGKISVVNTVQTALKHIFITQFFNFFLQCNLL